MKTFTAVCVCVFECVRERAELQPRTVCVCMIDEAVSVVWPAEGAVRYMSATFNCCARLPPVPNLSTVG